MGKYALKTAAKRLEFEDLFIPDNNIWRECASNEDPTVFLPKEEYPIYIYFFKAARLGMAKIPASLRLDEDGCGDN